MSGVVDVLVLPPLVPTLVAGGAAFGALLAASAAGYAAYSALDKLRRDYEQGLTEFRQRSAEEQQQRTQLANQQIAASNLAVMLAETTNTATTENATVTFLREHAQELAQRIAEMPAPNQELLTECQSLLEDMTAAPAEMERHFKAYDRLFTAFSAEAEHAVDATALKSATASALAILREEIASPLLDAPECTEVRAELLSQLATVEALAVGRQASVAGQGLTLLRQRVYRELRQQAERLQTRATEQQAIREAVSEMLAKLQAISQLTMLPASCRRAETLLGHLRVELANPSAEHLAALQGIGKNVDALFAACEKALHEQLLTQYVSHSVSDVLLSLGYRVAEITPEEAEQQSYVAAFDDAVGVQFNIDGTGHLTTEMVALNAGAAEVNRDTQEKVCSMIDQVLDALKQHDYQVRERYRSHFEESETLRVVELPASETHESHTAEPKVMRIDES